MRLSLRIVAIAFLAAAMGFLSAAALVKVTVFRNHARAAERLRASLTESHVEACERAPATWSFDFDRAARAFAYDTSWRTSNPLAPVLGLDAAVIPVERGSVLRIPRSREHGAVVAVRVRDAGPCAIVAAHFNAPPQQQDPTLPAALVLALVTSATATLGFLAIVRPFLRRVEEVRRA